MSENSENLRPLADEVRRTQHQLAKRFREAFVGSHNLALEYASGRATANDVINEALARVGLNPYWLWYLPLRFNEMTMRFGVPELTRPGLDVPVINRSLQVPEEQRSEALDFSAILREGFKERPWTDLLEWMVLWQCSRTHRSDAAVLFIDGRFRLLYLLDLANGEAALRGFMKSEGLTPPDDMEYLGVKWRPLAGVSEQELSRYQVVFFAARSANGERLETIATLRLLKSAARLTSESLKPRRLHQFFLDIFCSLWTFWLSIPDKVASTREDLDERVWRRATSIMAQANARAHELLNCVRSMHFSYSDAAAFRKAYAEGESHATSLIRSIQDAVQRNLSELVRAPDVGSEVVRMARRSYDAYASGRPWGTHTFSSLCFTEGDAVAVPLPEFKYAALQEVLTIVIDNAFKHATGLSPSTPVKIKLTRGPAWIEIEVSNPTNTRERSAPDQNSSHGFGLQIAQQIIWATFAGRGFMTFPNTTAPNESVSVTRVRIPLKESENECNRTNAKG
jgi:signal transduction histidine kinase